MNTFLQENVLNFVYDAYNDETRNLVIPESLRMKKDISSRREIIQLKTYRTKNRYEITSNEECMTIVCCKELKVICLSVKAFCQP